MVRAITLSKPFAPLSGFLHCRQLEVCLEAWAVSDCLVTAGEGLVPTECELRMLASLWVSPAPWCCLEYRMRKAGPLLTKNHLVEVAPRSPFHAGVGGVEGRVSAQRCLGRVRSPEASEPVVDLGL